MDKSLTRKRPRQPPGPSAFYPGERITAWCCPGAPSWCRRLRPSWCRRPPRLGGAAGSSDRLWHAAKVAAAARIQSVFISSLLVAAESCPRGLVADVRQLRALRPMTDQAEALTYAREWALTRSWITFFGPVPILGDPIRPEEPPNPGTTPGRQDWPAHPSSGQV